MGMPAGGPGFDRGQAQLPGHVRRRQQPLGLRVVAHRGKEAALALEDTRRPGQTAGRKFGREQAGLGCAARVQVFAHRAGRHEFPEAAGLGAGVAEGVARLRRVEPEQARRRHRRAERTAGRGIVPDAVMRRSHRGADAAHRLEALQHGFEQIAR